MMAQWYTALIYVLGIAVFVFLANRLYGLGKHRSEMFDDRLTGERMDSARIWLLERGGERKRNGKLDTAPS
jgi:hypothetical protein